MDKRSIVFLISITAAFFLVKLWYGQKEAERQREWQKAHTETVVSSKPSTIEPPPQAAPEVQATPSSPAKFYVLGNDYQQLVFSTVGGSIVEINLPFKSSQFPKSAVLPVESDRKIAEQSPKEDYFPGVEAAQFDGSTLQPALDKYYPLLRRFYTKEPSISAASHESCALTSPYAEFSALPFQVTSFTKTSITFEARQPHRIIKKRFSFPKDPSKFPYCVDVEVTIDGDRKDVWITSGILENELMSGTSGDALKYRVIRGSKGDVEKVDLPKTAFTSSSIQPDWVCNSNGFFGIILDPIKGSGAGMAFNRVAGTLAPSRLLYIDTAQLHQTADDFPGFEAKIPFSQSENTLQLRLFAGPFADSVLSTIDENSLLEYSKPTNFSACQSFHGWFAFISEPFAKFLFFLMKQFYRLFGSWVLSIILVTIVLRILLYPLNRWSMRSMRSMQEIAPLVKAIQDKYKKDPTKAQMEIMALYREKKVNPFSGCLPLLIQMPFLIGMFDLLRSSFELRGTPFIPGWIDNLSAPDVLFDWKFHIPLLGSQLHILPFVLGATMWWQQNLSSTLPKDPREWSDQQRQQRAMGNIMTVVMTILFYQFPAGLNIYWISSMLLGIGQQWWTNRQMAKQAASK
jgi:YidC/Oxa1 family membrane protein insertase